MDIHIDNASSAAVPASASISAWAGSVLGSRKPDAELSIRLVDEAEITDLNKTYRGKDKATNVLSFPTDLPEFVELPLLGDIVICPQIVEREALEQGKSSEAHWAHMVVHGTLHLLGYDHIEDSEAEQMESLETEILLALGYPAPYTHQ